MGCSILDGECIWNDTPHEINCQRCIKALLEALAGCPHEETYIDNQGTVRCKACHFELDQVEDPDPTEPNADEYDARQDEDMEVDHLPLDDESALSPDEEACRGVFWNNRESQDRPLIDIRGQFMIA
ncbi:hypothetical protein TRIP_B200236 [uncultured Desulfatiglans sp.]|uniref:Uncharacterized protein n=1 Tax=Uncultured Desulfatiglans sp. TaxID=1748965 RepID=A0A653A237_UNCDX|nr:hypothetical protein TRIP_B200236 [uncultured Desulfatiglans sp.]